MKAKLKFKQLTLLLTVFSIVLVTSCNKEEVVIAPESDIPPGVELKSAAEPAPNDMVCDLVAGQFLNVGNVVYSDDGTNFLVEYITTDGWVLSEVHFYVGNMEDFQKTCMNRKAVQIGKFPYSAENIDNMTVSFEIPLGEIEPEENGSFLVVAHAVVKNGEQEETGFANCAYQPVIITAKARFQISDNESRSGVSEGIPFSLDLSYWCSWMGINEYDGDATYIIHGWGNFEENQYGQLKVTENGGELKIEVIADPGFTLISSWVYVGTMNGLLSYLNDQYNDGVCPEYWRFPYSNLTEGSSHLYSLPLPEPIQSSISFEQAFNINRWGWISYYTPK